MSTPTALNMMQRGESRLLPARCKRALDAEGVVRGKTWRMMSGGYAGSQEMRALNWFFWKRGLDVGEGQRNAAQRAKWDALRAIQHEDEEVVA